MVVATVHDEHANGFLCQQVSADQKGKGKELENGFHLIKKAKDPAFSYWRHHIYFPSANFGEGASRRTELIGFDTELLQHAEVKVGERVVVFLVKTKMTLVLEPTAGEKGG